MEHEKPKRKRIQSQSNYMQFMRWSWREAERGRKKGGGCTVTTKRPTTHTETQTNWESVEHLLKLFEANVLAGAGGGEEEGSQAGGGEGASSAAAALPFYQVRAANLSAGIKFLSRTALLLFHLAGEGKASPTQTAQQISFLLLQFGPKSFIAPGRKCFSNANKITPSPKGSAARAVLENYSG